MSEAGRHLQAGTRGPQGAPAGATGASPRALVLGVVLTAALVVVTANTDGWGFARAVDLSSCQFPVGPVMALVLILLSARWLLRRLPVRRPLGAHEVLVITAMMLVAAGIPSYGLALYLLPTLSGTSYYATPENKWREEFFQYLPAWIQPDPDSPINEWFYEGLPPTAGLPWREWLTPLAAWSVLTLAFYLAVFCLASIVRRQWSDRENLIYPMVKLPVEMVLGDRRSISPLPFFADPLMWIGFAIPFLFHNLNAIYFHCHGMPLLNLRRGTFLLAITERPWIYLRSGFYVHFAVIGFAYFLTTEISFSVWVFWWLSRFLHVGFDAFGRRPLLAKVEEHTYQGAFVVYVLSGIWVARGHLRDVWDRVTQRRRGPVGERPEAMPMELAFWGLIVAGAVVVIWLRLAGMSLLLAIVTYLAYLVIAWGLGRMVAESGILFARALHMKPSLVLSALAGPRALSPADVTILHYVEWTFMFDQRSSIMAQVTQSLKIADEAQIDRRGMYRALALATLIALPLGLAALLQAVYAAGGIKLDPWLFLSAPRSNAMKLVAMMSAAPGIETDRLLALLAGGAFCALLIRLRQLFLWFPLHPIAYILGDGFQGSLRWLPFLIGWLLKVLTLRYGSVSLYRRLQAPALGLVLGEYSAGALWLIINGILHTTGYRIFP
ncbi:MAG: DUF6785 family protein [Armatimonadota bacterium]